MHVNMHAWAYIAGVVGQRRCRGNSSGASGHVCGLLPWNQSTSAAVHWSPCTGATPQAFGLTLTRFTTPPHTMKCWSMASELSEPRDMATALRDATTCMCSCQGAQGSLPGTVKQRRQYTAHPLADGLLPAVTVHGVFLLCITGLKTGTSWVSLPSLRQSGSPPASSCCGTKQSRCGRSMDSWWRPVRCSTTDLSLTQRSVVCSRQSQATRQSSA